MKITKSNQSDSECSHCKGSGKKFTNIGDYNEDTVINFPGPNDPCEYCDGTGKTKN